MPPLVADAIVCKRRVTPPGNKLWAKSDEIVFQPGLAPGFFMESSAVFFGKHPGWKLARGTCRLCSSLAAVLQQLLEQPWPWPRPAPPGSTYPKRAGAVASPKS